MEFLPVAAVFVAFISILAFAPKIFPHLSKPSKDDPNKHAESSDDWVKDLLKSMPSNEDPNKHAAPAKPTPPGCGGCLLELVGGIITVVVTLAICLALLVGLVWLIKRIWQSV